MVVYSRDLLHLDYTPICTTTVCKDKAVTAEETFKSVTLESYRTLTLTPHSVGPLINTGKLVQLEYL